MHSTRTAVLAMLVALLLPAPAVLAETVPPDRSKTAGPISAELAKKCRALAIKAHPTKPAGSARIAVGRLHMSTESNNNLSREVFEELKNSSCWARDGLRLRNRLQYRPGLTSSCQLANSGGYF